MSAQDSLVRLKQLNQPEASGFILAVVLPYLQTGLFGGVNTGTLTGVFYPRNSNPSGYLRNSDITGYATLAFVSGNNDTLYSYVNAHFYPLTSNPSGYITTGQTGSFGSNANLSGFVTTGQTGQFYPSSNPSGFITSAQAGGIQSISITGKNLSGVLTFSGLNGIQLSSSGQIVYISSAVDSTFVRTTGNQTILGNKSFVGSLTTVTHGSGTDFILDNVKNSSNKTILNALGRTINDGGAANNLSIDFGNRGAWDSNGFLVLDWNLKKLFDASSQYSLDWNNRNLLDNTAAITLDWQKRSLTGGLWTLSGKPIATGGPYYPLTGNPAGFLTSGGSFYPKTGNPSGYLETTGTSVRHVSANVQFDGTLIVSGILDSSLQTLRDSSHNNSIDWTNRFMYDAGGFSSIAWNSRQLLGSWLSTNFQLFDTTSNFKALNFDTNSSWYLQSLYPNGNAIISFYDSAHSGTMPYISGFNLVNCGGITGTIDTTKVVFTTGNQGISGSKTFGNQTTFSSGIVSQILTGTSSSASSIDLNSGVLLDNQRNIVIDWRNYILYGNPTDGTSFDFTQGIYRGEGGIKVIEGISSLLYDNSELRSLSWSDRQLIDNNNIQSMDWQSRNLYDVGNGNSVDYGNRKLNNGATNILDWGNSLLIDSTSINSLDWQNRVLFDSTQTRALEWGARILSGTWQVSNSFIGGGATSGISGSLAFGNGARARSKSTIALVQDADAFANWAVAIGFGASAGGASSFSMGEDAATSAYGCYAIGAGASAQSLYSIAMGRGAITKNPYSFVIGMQDLPTIQDNQDNQFVARFTGGFILTGSAVQAQDFQISGQSVHHGDILYDSSDNPSLDLLNRKLLRNGVGMIDWNVGSATDPLGALSIQWNDADRKLYDTAALFSVDWDGRLLYDNTNAGGDFGTGLSVDWGARKLYDTGHHITLDWQKKTLSGTWNAQGLTINGQAVLSSGSFYPLNTNPSGYITTGQTGAFGGSANTGALTGVFYPLLSNPSGYASTGNYADISGAGGITIVTGTNIIYVSGNFYPLGSNPSGFITTGQTGAFGSAGNTGVLTGVFYPLSGNPNSFVSYSGLQKGIYAPSIVSGKNYQIDFIQGFIEKIDLTPVIDLGNSQLFDQGGTTTVDWNQNVLGRDDGETSIDWNHNRLCDAGSVPVLDWTKQILTGTWSAGDIIVSGISVGAAIVEGTRIIKSNKLDFRTTGTFNLFTVPTGFLFNIDAMEIITTDIASPSAAPYIQLGNTSIISAYQPLNQTISNSQFARHIYDNPQDSVNAGITLTATITTASTASMHSGFLLYKGYLLRNL